jgi:DNA-directed RNA polymerase specialized sigma24 family protein
MDLSILQAGRKEAHLSDGLSSRSDEENSSSDAYQSNSTGKCSSSGTGKTSPTAPTASIDPTSEILRHQEMIESMARRCAGRYGLTSYDSDEIVADALSQTWIAMHGFDPRRSVTAYIASVINNMVRDRIRKDSCRKRLHLAMSSCRSRGCVGVEIEIDVADRLGAMTPGQQERLLEISFGSVREKGTLKQDIRRKANRVLIEEARIVFADYRPADQGEES